MVSEKCTKLTPKSVLITTFVLSVITDSLYFILDGDRLFGKLSENRTGLCELAAAIIYEGFIAKCCWFAFVERNQIDLLLLVIMSIIKSFTITLVTLPWDQDKQIFNIISLVLNILYIGNNLVFGWFEYRWNISAFIVRAFGYSIEMKENLKTYWYLKAQGQLFTLFGIVLAVVGALIVQGFWSYIIMGAIGLWFIYTAFLDVFFKYELWKVLWTNAVVSFVLFNFMLFYFVFGENSCNESKPNHCYAMSDGLRTNVYVFYGFGQVILIAFFVNLHRWRSYFDGRIKTVFSTLYQYKKKHL